MSLDETQAGRWKQNDLNAQMGCRTESLLRELRERLEGLEGRLAADAPLGVGKCAILCSDHYPHDGGRYGRAGDVVQIIGPVDGYSMTRMVRVHNPKTSITFCAETTFLTPIDPVTCELRAGDTVTLYNRPLWNGKEPRFTVIAAFEDNVWVVTTNQKWNGLEARSNVVLVEREAAK